MAATDIVGSLLHSSYSEVQWAAANYRNALSNLYNAMDTEHPTIYVASADKKQYWFFRVETVMSSTDALGTYAISATGKGIRIYLTDPVEPAYIVSTDPNSSYYITSSRYLAGEDHQPGSYNAFTHSELRNKLCRYEVFGAHGTATPSKISISDLFRNSTIPNVDDYLIGIIPYPNFVGNFAKWASYIVGSELAPNT